VGSVWFGAFIGHLLTDTEKTALSPASLPRTRIMHMLPLAVIQFAFGLVLHFVGVPLNKNLYSISYCLFMGGAATLCLLVFYLVVDVLAVVKPWLPLVWMGQNSIAVFIGYGIFEKILKWVYYETPEKTIVWLLQVLLIINLFISFYFQLQFYKKKFSALC
jgi:predicted acyltransferase